jgi:hypothetical protein
LCITEFIVFFFPIVDRYRSLAMARMWTWGELNTNPFVDFSTTWIEPAIQRAVDIIHTIQPDLLNTITYLAVIGVAYLFHSPFRAHSTAATDTYGRVTKLFQTWSTVVFFCFHLGPQIFRSKQNQLQHARSENEAVPMLFFPLFITFNCLISFLHKMKRRWRLGVTYGGRISLNGLNSLTLAAVGTMHYAYCSSLYENSTNRYVKGLLFNLTPAPVLLHPFRCLAKVVLLSCGFIVIDYEYKKWHGFDPSRGILWSELYALRKLPRDVAMGACKRAGNKRKDWRELVAPPRVYTQAALSATGPARLLSSGRGVPSCVGAVPTSLNGRTSAVDAQLPPSLRPPRALYHECPADMSLDLAESKFDADDAALRRVYGSSDSSSLSLYPSQPSSFDYRRDPPQLSSTPASLDEVVRVKVHKVEHADPSLMSLMSFRAPRFMVQEVQEAKHPVNRPGMVPWWSTFVLFTAWQTVAGATLRFLAFDVRTIQGFTTPKIFHLHFSSSLRRCVATASRCASGAACVVPPSTAATRDVKEEEKDALQGNTGGSETHHSSRPFRVGSGAVEEGSASAEEEGEQQDVWFDWIADVGDGFNPTYTMARLLAQPSLRLPVASATSRKKKQQQPTDHLSEAEGQTSGGNHYHNTKHGEDGPTAASPRRTARMAVSAPTSPRYRAGTTASPLFLAPPPFVSTTTAATAADGDDEIGATCCGEGRTARSQTTVFPPPPTTFARVLETSHTSIEDEGEEDKAVAGDSRADHRQTHIHNDHECSREAVSATFSLHAPPRCKPLNASRPPKAGARQALVGVEKNGYATLPRGSFVVVGGDLAYPSPDDDTYTTRLFEPYNDALSSNLRLQNVFHAEQRRVVVADAEDIDVAHVHLLNAETVSGIVSGRGSFGVGRGTAELALRSVPLLFAIPGNHDWFDGLSTYRKYILERTWIGGWLMPQRSSFFVLRLPFNWYMLCGDTGNTQDIDVAQRNYFLDVIEKYMDAESCVILAAHEPGWLLDAMEREDKPKQPELNRVVEALGTRLRLRLAGDIHNYSRHVPTNPFSEAATLVVSGGGGAFLHGPRKDPVISQGTRYVRACAFPNRTTFTNMAARLWGFRVVNWKFDMVVGFLCFVILLSALPLPVETEMKKTASGADPFASVSVAKVFSLWVAYATRITSHIFTKGVISILPLLFFWVCFSTAGSDRHARLSWRVCYGAVWTFGVLLCCSGAMAFVHVQILYLMDNGFLSSAEGRWSSVMESQVKMLAMTFFTHACEILGGEQSVIVRTLDSAQSFVAKTTSMRWLLVLLRCLDPFETFSFLSTTVSSGQMGVFAEGASRLQILIYYLYVFFFYWIATTPIVSTLIGTFLLFSVTSFDYMYDGTYSAFQIEEFKHFIRFRIDAKTRQLHAYVIAVKAPAKVYELDRRYVWSLTAAGVEEHRPPHLRRHPSRWAPVQIERGRDNAEAEVLEYFTVHPHRVPKLS